MLLTFKIEKKFEIKINDFREVYELQIVKLYFKCDKQLLVQLVLN